MGMFKIIISVVCLMVSLVTAQRAAKNLGFVEGITLGMKLIHVEKISKFKCPVPVVSKIWDWTEDVFPFIKFLKDTLAPKAELNFPKTMKTHFGRIIILTSLMNGLYKGSNFCHGIHAGVNLKFLFIELITDSIHDSVHWSMIIEEMWKAKDKKSDSIKDWGKNKPFKHEKEH